MAFAVEEIPGEAALFLRVHKDQFVTVGEAGARRPSSACFRRPRLSVNWEKYSTPEGTAKPTSAAVVALRAHDCRSLGQTVEHTPIQAGEVDGPNQAHSEVCGPKEDKVIQNSFVRLSKVVWVRIPAPA